MPCFKTSQFVPGKGSSWTYYDAKEDGSLLRMMTHLPETGETTRYPNPVVKRLFRPEMLEPAAAAEFEALWNAPGGTTA